MFIPVRGIASLTRAAVLIVAGAVVSKGFKSTKPFAKSMGENIEKFGKWLQEESEETTKPDAKAEPAKAAAPKQETKPKTAAATKRAPATKRKPATARKAAAKKPAEPKAKPSS